MATLSSRALTDLVFERLLATTGPKARILVAYSGGLDSTVLAHLLISRRRQLGGLRLAHVDHGLQSASRAWSAACRRQARQWGVPFVAIEVNVATNRGASVEAMAREARYEALAKVLEPGEFLVTAHHRDDQVETLLLQLFRGAGVSGLAAMPYSAPFSRGRLLRPLLSSPRGELERYAADRKLAWNEDPSNQADRFDRNYLRRTIMPLLRKRWPGVAPAIHRTSGHMAEAAQMLEAVAAADLVAVVDGSGLNAPALRALPLARRKNALRQFIRGAGVEMPAESKLREISGALLAARPDAQPAVRWSGAVIRRRVDRLELHVEPETPQSNGLESIPESWRWSEERAFRLNNGDRVELLDDPSGPIDMDKLPPVLELRARRGGESLRRAPKARTQTLKKLMQAARLTIEERARLPLLFGEGPKGRLIAAGDRWLDASVSATVKSRRRARLVWKKCVGGRQ